ncbi:MAG: ammonia channel protein, partial [Rhodomicrobium sp.]
FGVHGVGGNMGTLLTGVFATASVSINADTPAGLPGLLEGNPGQLLTQLYGVAVTILWCGAVTFVLLRLVSVFSPLRVPPSCEIEGLDISQHGESIHA